jgi:N-acetylglucosaminyldiphosphoundecaprenol N-acetyl-beta-D-mannosaminyltransferase
MIHETLIESRNNPSLPSLDLSPESPRVLGARAGEGEKHALTESQAKGDRVWIWGVPFSPLTRAAAAELVMKLVEARRPSMFVTANTHYTMLTNHNPALGEVNSRAAFVLADGAPLVWASRLKRTPLPERVAGSDLIFDLCELAAARNYRPFLLGGGPGVAEAAAKQLVDRFPGLQIAGTACPSNVGASANECEELIEQVREARADLLFAALGQPKGELWLARHLDRLRVPACVQIGASLDFIAGRVRRAPPWVQRIGMEWAYRLSLEPVRLGPRYARNAGFLAKRIMVDLISRRSERISPGAARLSPRAANSHGEDHRG